jgi:hypothetical protein
MVGVHTSVDTSWSVLRFRDLINSHSSSSYCELGPSQQSQTQSQAGEQGGIDRTSLFSILVTVKSLLKFLSCHVVSTTTIACVFALFSQIYYDHPTNLSSLLRFMR